MGVRVLLAVAVGDGDGDGGVGGCILTVRPSVGASPAPARQFPFS